MTEFKKGTYQHYKGMLYNVIDVVKHSETLEDLVLYECLYDNDMAKIWVRPYDMFVEKVIIDGIERPRFQYVGNKKASERI